jgi:hypothetical protein
MTSLPLNGHTFIRDLRETRMAKDSMHPKISTLEIKLVEPGDISAITELWYNAFNIPQNLQMFPDTPGVRQWWNEAHRQDILHNPHRRYLKVVDVTSPGFIVAYAKWDLDPQQSGPRFPPWHEESDHQACNELFGMLEKERNKFFGEKQFYCRCLTPTLLIDLDVLD